MCVCVCYLCPRYGPEGIGGSQDWLVVHDRLRGHHGNAPHLMTHLRGELVGGQVSAGGPQGEGEGQTGQCGEREREKIIRFIGD